MKDISDEKVGARLSRHKWAGLVITLLLGTLVVPSPAFAARPLVTDDAGTIGKGKMQAEFGAEVFSWRDTVEDVRVKETGMEVSGSFVFGILENVDIVAGFPYAWDKIQENGATTFNRNGILDTSLEMKWRFYEKDGFGLAVKPGITLPAGNHERGLGTGRVTYGLNFIATKEVDALAFHFNAGYRRNENDAAEREDIWSASFAAQYSLSKALTLVANVGAKRNCDPSSKKLPAFLLGGVSYAVNDRIALDAGYRIGLNKAEVHHGLITGITVAL